MLLGVVSLSLATRLPVLFKIPRWDPSRQYFIWGEKPNLIQDLYECNVNNSMLVAPNVFLPNEIDMNCPALEQKILPIAGDWILGLNHLLSLRAFVRGVLTILTTSMYDSR